MNLQSGQSPENSLQHQFPSRNRCVTVRIFRILSVQVRTRSTLPPETNTFAPENGWLEDEILFWGWPIFTCYVSF